MTQIFCMQVQMLENLLCGPNLSKESIGFLKELDNHFTSSIHNIGLWHY